MPSLWRHPSSLNSSLRILQDPEHSSYKRSKAGAWETAEWVKCLLCQCEDLSSDPQHPYNTSTGWGWAWGAGRPASLDKMSGSYSVRDPLSKTNVKEAIEGDNWHQLLASACACKDECNCMHTPCARTHKHAHERPCKHEH